MARHYLGELEQIVLLTLLRLGEDATVLVLSGPNAGGKTVAMKAVALAVLMVRCGLFVTAAPAASDCSSAPTSSPISWKR